MQQHIATIQAFPPRRASTAANLEAMAEEAAEEHGLHNSPDDNCGGLSDRSFEFSHSLGQTGTSPHQRKRGMAWKVKPGI